MSSPSHSPPGAGNTWADVEVHRLHARVMGRLFGEPAAPTTIGRFRVERRLGSGAMGVVYAAVDAQLGRRVAIKLLHPHLQGDEQGRARLLREARAMARLEHAHVARIYEVGAWGDQVYIAMELIEGVTLEAWLHERPRPWQAVLAVYLQAGRALAAAHRAGLLHRDFKPENVLVDASDCARVLDFGLTCAMDAGEALDDELAPLTRTGSILGTPAYMAPEQQRYGAAEPRSDQFSFCVALFEGLFGLRPFGALPRPGALEIAPIPRDSKVPARIRRAIVRGLAEKPEDRWPTMDDLLAALQPRRAQPPRGWPLLLGGAGVAAVGALAWALVGSAESAPADADAREQALEHLRNQLEDPTGELAAQRAAAERHARALQVRDAAVALLPRDPTTAALLLRELDDPGALALRVLTEPIAAAILRGHEGPVVAVRWVAGEAGDVLGDRPSGEAAIATLDATGGARTFAAAGGVGQPGAREEVDLRRGPGGERLRADARGQVSLEVGERVRAVRGATGPLAAVAWSPEGERVAAAGPRGEVWLVATRDARTTTIAARGAPVGALAWDAAGGLLAVGRDDGEVEVWQVEGRPRRVAAVVGKGGVTGLAFGAGWLASGSDDGSARVWRIGAAARPLVLRGHAGPVRALAFAPGGARLVTGSDDGTARVWRLAPAALAEHDLGAPLYAVAWSPDGELLAAAGERGVWLLPRDGGPARRREHAGTARALAWSPDGQQLAVADELGAVTWLPRGEGAARRQVVDRRPLHALAWDARDERLVAGGAAASFFLWPKGHVEGDMSEPTRAAHNRGVVAALAWSPVDERLAAVTAAGHVLVRREKTVFIELGHPLRALAWSPSGDALAVAGEGRALIRVAAATGARSELGRAAAGLESVAWDPRDRWIVAGAADGALHFWPLHGEAGPEVLLGHADGVRALAFDREGERLASAGGDGRVVVWPRLDGDLRPRLAAATRACLAASERRRHLGEPEEAADARAEACERGASRSAD